MTPILDNFQDIPEEHSPWKVNLLWKICTNQPDKFYPGQFPLIFPCEIPLPKQAPTFPKMPAECCSHGLLALSYNYAGMCSRVSMGRSDYSPVSNSPSGRNLRLPGDTDTVFICMWKVRRKNSLKFEDRELKMKTENWRRAGVFWGSL